MTGGYPVCTDGMILPAWTPLTNLSKGDVVARGLVYFAALVYIFVGVSIVADRFMAAIEVITSKEKEVVIRRPDGETRTVSVRVWNETVSNLTLMALGSSAPEILLSVIEVVGQGFEAGELGPGTIVGSAAFNMFVIIAICVWCIPSGEHRKIKHLRVFFVTMTWSVFAYVWLYVILAVSSYGVIEVWEAAVTFLFFPATVLTAYIADRRLLVYRCLGKKKYRANKRGVIVGGEGEGDCEAAAQQPPGHAEPQQPEPTDDEQQFEAHRRDYVKLLRDLRKAHPDKTMEELELMAREEILEKGPKSRAFYRLQATKKLTGNLIRKRTARGEGEKPQTAAPEQQPVEETLVVGKVYFSPEHYTVLESVGRFAVGVERTPETLPFAVCVDFSTEDGTAEAGEDYEPTAGTLVFRPGEARQLVWITIIDDDVFEEDEHFCVRLSNPRYLDPWPDGIPHGGGIAGHAHRPPLDVIPSAGYPPDLAGHASYRGAGYHLDRPDGIPGHAHRPDSSPPDHAPPVRPRPPLAVAEGEAGLAMVVILDDDHSGVFGFEGPEQEVPESCGEFRARVVRCSGARGRVVLPFRTREGSATNGRDYRHVEGILVFENNENR